MAVLIFDIGKTNKKILVFNEDYQIVYEESKKFAEIKDADGFHTEDLIQLKNWMLEAFSRIIQEFPIRAINFSGYGASGVAIDKNGQELGYLINYLKPADEKLVDKFWALNPNRFHTEKISSSPWMGNLNTGYQWFERLHKENMQELAYFLHFPNYLSFVFHGEYFAEMTSIGCHTMLWDFPENSYLAWIKSTGLENYLPKIKSGYESIPSKKYAIQVGMGLHDSSSALIPYLKQFKSKFILISTGTWCISMNPFNKENLSEKELENDVLCYLTPEGQPIKASRLFAGNEHEEVLKQLVEFFSKESTYFHQLKYNDSIKERFLTKFEEEKTRIREANFLKASDFRSKKLTEFSSAAEAYEEFILDLVIQQLYSLRFVFDGNEEYAILVDGGFSKNSIFMNCLKLAYPKNQVFAAEVGQASSLGAALAIHSDWNHLPMPKNLVKLNLIE